MYGLEISEEIAIADHMSQCLHKMPISGNLGKTLFNNYNFKNMSYKNLSH